MAARPLREDGSIILAVVVVMVVEDKDEDGEDGTDTIVRAHLPFYFWTMAVERERPPSLSSTLFIFG